MTVRRRRSDRSGRSKLHSPGRPDSARREELVRFWAAIATGRSSEDSARDAGVSPPVECFAAFPCEPSLSERGLRDGVSGLYVQCKQRGELVTLGQRATDVSALLAEALNRFGRPSLVVADRWREAELRDALDKANIPPAALNLRGMGFKDGAEDVRNFRRGFADGKVTPLPSLLLRSAMSEARTVSDPAGNSKLSKGSQGGRRLRARDDAAAAILAVSAGVARSSEPTIEDTGGALLGAFIG